MQSYENLTTGYLKKSHWLQSVYPWLVISLSAFFMFYKYILQVSPSVMTSDLMRTFHVTGAGLGNLAACFFYTYLIMQIPVGLLLDRYSPRLLTSIAIAACALGAYGFANTHSLHIAELSRALIGFGAAFATVSYLKMTVLWFPPKRFSVVAGFLATAAMLGAIGGEAPVAAMVSHWGWQHTLNFWALMGLIFAGLFYVVAKNRSENNIAAANAVPTVPMLQGLWMVVKNPQNLLLSFYSGLAFIPIDVFAGLWGVPFLMQYYTLSRTAAAAAASFAFLGLAAGAPLLGWFSDYLGKRKIVMLMGTSLSAVALILALYLPPTSFVLLALLLFLFGLGTGSFMLCFTVGTERNPIFLAATVVAIINATDALWGAISEPLIGKLLDLGWTGAMKNGARVFSVHDYHLSLLILPGYLLLALLLLFWIKDSGRNAVAK